jgi:hypothetical protein
MDFLCWSCWAFNCQCDCISAYGCYLDPKCCVYDTTVSTYVVYNTLMLDHGWLCFAPKFN